MAYRPPPPNALLLDDDDDDDHATERPQTEPLLLDDDDDDDHATERPQTEPTGSGDAPTQVRTIETEAGSLPEADGRPEHIAHGSVCDRARAIVERRGARLPTSDDDDAADERDTKRNIVQMMQRDKKPSGDFLMLSHTPIAGEQREGDHSEGVGDENSVSSQCYNWERRSTADSSSVNQLDQSGTLSPARPPKAAHVTTEAP
eukprot:5778401-Prymnesium_polylepis.1